MNVTGKTQKLGVMGNPVEHSISPQLHNTMTELMGLDYIYAAYKVKVGEVEKALDAMKTLNIRGFNVTIPHKVTAFELCDEVDPFAKKMGACNTLVNENGVIKGYNTDGPGFVRSLARENVSVEGKRVIAIGAGGAAQGVCMALADAGCESIGIINRTEEKAVSLAKRINRYYKNKAYVCSEVTDTDILINTTSVGMNSDLIPVEVDFEKMNRDCVVCDVVYCPRETTFLKKAADAGLKTVGGIGMLINQAVTAFELFTKTEVDGKIVEELYKMTSLDKSIVLTGFMGTGKTSVARRLCDLTGAEFIDTDQIIEKETGKEIKDIFALYGEEYFRDLESAVIKRLKNKKGAVISLGGGAVIRRENIDLLRENNVVFCLSADIDKIFENIGGKTQSRPLLSGKTKEEAKKLLDERREAYSNCDYTVCVTDLKKGEAADKILEIYINEGR